MRRRRAPHRSSTGRSTVLGMWLAIAILLVGLSTARLFLWPWAPPVTRADAVVVLAGDHGDRLAKGIELVRAGVAPVLVLDGQPDLPSIAALCHSDQPFEIVCLRPRPDSTRTEAREAARLAVDRGWRSLVVVTTRSHTTRAGLVFRRCTAGDVSMVGTNPPYGVRVKVKAIWHEWLGLGNAVLRERTC